MVQLINRETRSAVFPAVCRPNPQLSPWVSKGPKACSRFVPAIAAFLSLVLLVAKTDAQTPRQVAQTAFRSVVLITMEDVSGKRIALASGFFVRKDVVATSLHVIKNATKGDVQLIGQTTRYPVVGVVAIDRERDLVLLRVSGTNAPFLPLGNTANVGVGDEIYVVGNPQGLEGTFSQGLISGIRRIDSGTLFQITAPISEGSSGGPVLDKQGRVIGVAFATLKTGQNLNFVVPAAYLLPLLALMSPPQSLATVEGAPAIVQRSELPRVIMGVDGAEMLLVPAGVFTMGSDSVMDPLAHEDEQPAHKIFLDAYYIDKYEVTVWLYLKFVGATNPPDHPAWQRARTSVPNLPVVATTKDDANAYCAWAKKRLPTEAEWEKAARGTDGRRFPWGDQWPISSVAARRANGNNAHGKPMPVGSFPDGASPYGVQDMAGNVSEWVADSYLPDYYRSSPTNNPKGPLSGRRLSRGGSFAQPEQKLRTTYRALASEGLVRVDEIGFRCARDAAPK